jgi:aryl-alcohol dehydrogenase-like predicted oxidoreductase
MTGRAMIKAAPRTVADRPMFPVALGGASWSMRDHPMYGETERPDDERVVRMLHAALDCGITLIDTARGYTTADHPGYSEALIARALETHPAGGEVLVATKGGHYRAGAKIPNDVSRDTIRRHCETSRELLGVEEIELYQLHIPDPDVPIATTMETFAELRDEGAICHVGVCNVSIEQLEEAMSVVPIATVQNRFSPLYQDNRALLDFCERRSIAFLAYSPLSGNIGLLAGATRLGEAFPAAAALAQRKQVSIQRLALAWLLTLSPAVIPITGASRPETIRDSALAAELTLTEEDLMELDFATGGGPGAGLLREELDRGLQQIVAEVNGRD